MTTPVKSTDDFNNFLTYLEKQATTTIEPLGGEVMMKETATAVAAAATPVPYKTNDQQLNAWIVSQLQSNFLFMSLDEDSHIDDDPDTTLLQEIATEFEIVEYDPGQIIVEQGKPRIDGAIYYYLVIEGECTMTKDGIKVLGPTKGMKRGESFGETDFLFGNTLSSHTVIASKTGKVVLCRLKDTLYDYHITLDVKVKLQRHMSEICNVMDVLSGVNTKNSNAAIIHPYIPSELWLLRQWDGTVLQYVWQKVVMMMIFSALFSIAIYFIPGGEFALLGVEDGDGDGGGGMAAIDEQLDYIKGFWEKLLPLASFVSAFFLNEAYKHWRDFYWTCRGMLGKFNDISVAMAVAAARTEEEENDKKDNLTKSLTAGARKALEDIAHIQRLTHLLFWCTTVDRFNCILSPEGLSYLRMKHFMTQSEYTSMIQVCKKNLGAYNAGFTWLVSRIATAVKNGDIVADKMISPNYSLLELRSLMARIDSLNSARMVLAYVHTVYLLMEILICLSPIALHPLCQFWSIPATGVFTFFYYGVFKLSMMFLDPVDNDKKHQTKGIETAGFDVGVLIREAHADSMHFIEMIECNL